MSSPRSIRCKRRRGTRLRRGRGEDGQPQRAPEGKACSPSIDRDRRRRSPFFTLQVLRGPRVRRGCRRRHLHPLRTRTGEAAPRSGRAGHEEAAVARVRFSAPWPCRRRSGACARRGQARHLAEYQADALEVARLRAARTIVAARSHRQERARGAGATASRQPIRGGGPRRGVT